MAHVRHEKGRCTTTGSRDAGGDACACGAQCAKGRKPGSCCSCYWRQSFGGLRVAGTVSARWLGSVESRAAVRSPTETRRQESAVDLRYGDAKEPITAQVCVCVVDARDGGDADQG